MKRTVLLLTLVLMTARIFAGDLAILENLGFSPDGRYFMFGQHVLIPGTGQAYAEIALVDIARNDFVSDGWKKRAWNIRMLPNQDSRGALYELLADSADVKKRFGISHLEQGHLLYTRNADDENIVAANDDGLPSLSFRDFDRGREYKVTLHQNSENNGDDVSSSFYIEAEVTDTRGSFASYTIGRSGYMRKDVAAYQIHRVWAGPEGRALIFAIAKESPDLSIRYMVETIVVD